jgi:hypothetical protein
MKTLFAAVHEFALGPPRQFVATHRFGRYWRISGHSAKPSGTPVRRS